IEPTDTTNGYMPISPQQFTALEGAVNRLASESVLATVGRDDGLVPAYSLAAELCELCATEPVLLHPLKALLAELEKCLDNAQPFSAPLLDRLHRTIEWLVPALASVQQGQPATPFELPATAGGPAPGAATTTTPPHEKSDVLMRSEE